MLPSMTVAENVLIADFPTRGARIDRRAAHARVAALLARLQCGFDPDDPVEALGMGDRQMVEIARALARDPRIVIFDEPTSSLSDREKQRLFEVIARLKADGAAVIYITHFVDEIFQVCDRYTVMRGGRTVGTGSIAETDVQQIVRLMLGDIAERVRLRVTRPPGEPVLSVRNLSGGMLSNIGLTLRAGEILGLWGLLGSGRTEIMRALLGLDPISRGEIWLRRAGGLHPVAPAALRAEVGFVTEDRRGEGLLLPLFGRRQHRLCQLRQGDEPAGLDRPRAPAAVCRGAGAARRHHARQRRPAGAHAQRRQPTEGGARPLARHHAAPVLPR